ncbi:MAG: type II secretion system ATPase GspE [Deltaproteobacteria bacterium]|nr:type II secretion system ATPase GspE [Deltaproteobacteria bacterium]
MAGERRLGEILVEMGAIQPDRLEEALQVQREKGGKLGEILLKLKAIEEADLYRALGIAFGMRYLPKLELAAIDSTLVSQIPINFAKKNLLVPLKRSASVIEVAIADPHNLYPVDDVALIFGSRVEPILASPSSIVEVINALYERSSDTAESMMGDLEEQIDLDSVATGLDEPIDLLEAEDEAPIIRLVNSLLYQAVKERASDIHIEPAERELVVRFRVDGVLYDIIRPPKRIQSSVASRIKIMGGLNIAEKRLPQDGGFRIKIAGKDIDIRLSAIPTFFGERIVMRLLDRSSVLIGLEQLGFSKDYLEVMHRLIGLSHGILLVTGPTGSGKTTTLYAALSRINKPGINIITVEDPVEYQLKGIGQVQVNSKIELTFATALRSILRQDPDVIMIGEIRDLETAEIAIQASLTGHLVLSTLHTNDAAGAITRLVDMGVEPFLVSSSVVAILAQRLVRLVCKECGERYEPTDAELQEIGLERNQLSEGKLYRAQGCQKCLKTGYMGRSGIYELLLVDDAIRGMVTGNVDSMSIRKEAIKKGMRTLREDGALKVAQGETTTEEVLRVTQEDMIEIR